MKLTHTCNLTCLHCPFWRKGGESLSFDRALSALRSLHDRGVRLVILEGGEPLLWHDGGHGLGDVVGEAKKLFYCVGITTNGTLPIEVDADVVWVSIDGLRETQNRIRSNSFDTVVRTLESCRHQALYAHVTINALNWEEVPQLVRFVSPRVRGITVQFHYPFGGPGDELVLPFDKRRAVLDTLIGMKREGLPLANSYACLKALRDNRWKCRPWMIASVEPDGTVTHGCYVKERGTVACDQCGFSAHAEISLAYGGSVGAILLGRRIFGRGRAYGGTR